VLGLLLALPLRAQNDMDIMRTDWIEQTRGFQEAAVGAQVRTIEPAGSDGDSHTITLAIPKSAISDPEYIEEVVVVGKKPEEAEPLLNTRYEWLDDYDNDNYGLILHLGNDSTWPLRIYLSAKHGYLATESRRLME
jgi:hypothetical protein